MSRRNNSRRSLKQFGGPTFGDWAAFGLSAAGTGYLGTRLVRKTREASARRRSWEEEYDESDVVYDYGRGYYLGGGDDY